jgi:anti-sigma factor RsiW
MKHDSHPEHGRLIDFVEGELGREAAREVEAHLTDCGTCRAFVTSLEKTFSALEADRVPEPPEAVFAYLAGRARARASRRGRRLLLRFLPGLASAVAAALLIWWLANPQVVDVDGVDIIMADMTTGQIVEAVSMENGVESLLIEDSVTGLREIETYLLETETIYDLLDSMDEVERERFTAYLKRSMSGDIETSGLAPGCIRKEC